MKRAGIEGVLYRVYKSDALSGFLKAVSALSAVIFSIVFLFLEWLAFSESILTAVKLALILGAPFLAVGIIRKRINAKRPYEHYGFYEKPPRAKGGGSFPSRHAFSAFAIGTVFTVFNPLLGVVLLLLCCIMCVARVLLGIHFIRDVVAGAIIGVCTSVIGILIF